MGMQPAQEKDRPSGGVERDRALVPELQEMSRRLDMNASAQIAEVRDSLMRLIKAGKINPPKTSPADSQELTISEALRRIAQEEGLPSSHHVLERLPARKIAKAVRMQKEAAPEEPKVGSMTTPELTDYISQEIVFHSSFNGERLRPSKSDRMG